MDVVGKEENLRREREKKRTDIQTERQTERDRERETHTHTHTHTHTGKEYVINVINITALGGSDSLISPLWRLAISTSID